MIIAKLLAKNSKIAQIEIEGPEIGSKQNLKINANQLPANIEVGQVINIYLLASNQSTLEEKKLAKAILEEILNGK